MIEVAISFPVHRLIPSRFPPVLLFDWAQTQEELEQIAALEGLTNERLQNDYGRIDLVAREDWVGGPGSTPLMAAFTHPGISRFSDGTFGAYYASNSLNTSIAETKFHRERFLLASNEPPCLIQMREYTATVLQKLVDIRAIEFHHLLDPDPEHYNQSQAFAREIRNQRVFGLYYPSVRNPGGECVAIFRPPALSIPLQGRHLDYIWDGEAISQVRISQNATEPLLA